MKQFLKSTLFFFLRICAPSLGNRASILMYHSVGENGAFFTISPKEFERELAFLAKKKYSVIKLSTLLDALARGGTIRNAVVITFDDGYRDNFENAYPLLKKYSFPATIFVATDKIGKTEKVGSQNTPMLSEADITVMAGEGLVEFMPHTSSHARLAEISFAEAVREIEGSRSALEKITGIRADILAYPWGSYTKEISSYIKEKWRGGVTVHEGLVTVHSDRALLPRNAVGSATTFAQFKGKVVGAIALYVGIKKIFNG